MVNWNTCLNEREAKKITPDTDMAEEFDALRIIRNDLNYYGKEISIKEAKEVLKRLEQLRKNLEQEK